jgi:cytoskeleton protein RodZ
MVEDIKETVYIGAILKEYRENQNITINQIANQLHLDQRFIYAIESDDDDALPDPIYVRGYIRGYCKLLNLDTEEILQLYKENVQRSDPEIIPEIKYPTQSRSGDKPVKVFTYLISLGLVLLVITWWQSNLTIPSSSLSGMGVANTDTADAEKEKLQTSIPLEEVNVDQYLPVEEYTPVLPIEITINLGEEDPQPLNSFATSESSGVEIDGQIMEDISEEFISENSFDAIDNTRESVLVEATDITTGTESEELPPSADPDKLVLTLTADSWIEIFDANEKKVFYDLARTGQELILLGRAPFQILLGFAPGVSIEYNGNSVDHSPYTRAGVASFSLEE